MELFRSGSQRWPIVKIVGIYAVAGGLWIYSSDTILAALTQNHILLKQIAVLKGLFFIAMTSLLLYALISRHISKIAQAEALRRKSEEKYRVLHESLRDGYFFLDMNGFIKDSNEVFQHMIGYSGDDLFHLHYRDITPLQWHAYEQDIVEEQVRTKGYSDVYEKEYRRKDGTVLPVEIRVFLYKDERGIGQGMWALVRDISERKRADTILKESEIKFRSIFKNSHDAIGVSKNGIHVMVNPSYLAMFGYTNEHDLVGTSIANLVAPSHRDTISQYVHGRMDGRDTPRLYTTRAVRKDGSEFEMEVQVSTYPLNNELYTLVMLRDITARRGVEETLRRSEEHYRLLFLDNPFPLWVYDRQTLAFLDVNDAAVHHYGYTKEEFLSLSLKDIRPSEDIPVLLESVKKVESDLREPGTWRHRKKDGTIIDVEITTHDIEFEGKPARLVLANDVTNRKKAEEELRQSEEKFRRAFMTSPDSININRLEDGMFVSTNDGFMQIIGYTEKEAIGKTSVDLNVWANIDDRKRLVSGLKEHGKVENMEALFRTKDGTVITGLMSASIIQLNGVPHIISITRDISELKKLQQELLHSQKMVSVGTLAGGIAHDFNNILNIILGYSALLEKRKSDKEKFEECVQAITHAVERGTSLVRQILTFARKTEVEFELLSIYDLVRELFSMLKQTFPKTILFNERLEAGLPPLYADHSQIHQVLLNLCVNARDAMPHGGTVSIDARKMSKEKVREWFPNAEHEEYICLSVGDTGEGMDEATRSRIFDPFFTTKEKGKGTGLGLAVVYGIIHSHHGFIDVESESGSGTVFRVCLPLQKHGNLPPARKEPLQAKNIFGDETILIVEDEEMLSDLVSASLEMSGYSVLTAADGLEAVDVYMREQKKISVVITDLGLPGISGDEEFKKLRAINPDVKVVVASGFFDPKVKTDLITAGVNGFIQKPYKPDEVIKLLRDVLDRK